MTHMLTQTHQGITTWRQFNKIVRSSGCRLLARLDDFPRSILVAGCQRSGTTMLARIITTSAGMVNYRFGRLDELDGALILAGQVPHEPRGRYCFQTTYLNERYREYLEHQNGHKLVWVIRNPTSVVYSMLFNWGRNTPDALFRSCGVASLRGTDRYRYLFFGARAITPLRRACWAYVGKTAQLVELRAALRPDQLMIVDYDDLVMRKDSLLPAIFEFIGLEYRAAYADRIRTDSVSKKERLSRSEIDVIRSLCEPTYQQVRRLATRVPAVP